MFLILLFLSVISMFWVFLRYRRIGLVRWFLPLMVGWIISLTGYTLFLAQYIGLTYANSKMLYIYYEVRYFIATLPITPNFSSSLVTIGRSIMIICFLGFALSFYNVLSKKWTKLLQMVNIAVAVTNTIFYLPPIYSYIKNELTGLPYAANIVFRIWVICVLILSSVLILRSYQSCPIPMIRRRIGLIGLSLLSLQVYYFYTVFMGPVQLLDISTYYYVYPILENYTLPFGISGYYTFSLFTGVCLLICMFYIWKYSELLFSNEQADAQLLQRLTAFNPGIQVISHTLKNQIISLKILAQDSINLIKNAGGSEMYGQEILNNMEQLINISDNTLGRFDVLRSAFKRFHLDLGPVKVGEALNHALSGLGKTPGNITLNTDISDGDATIFADSYYFNEVISNIVTNAIEAIGTKPGGIININVYKSSPWVAIEIEDNGQGISAEKLPMIFEPFYTSKNSSNNWGLGLSYVKLIVYMHMGQVHASAGSMGGIKFTLLLPRIKADRT